MLVWRLLFWPAPLFDGFLFVVRFLLLLLLLELTSAISWYLACDLKSLFILRYFLKIAPNLLVILLHLDHPFPLFFSHIAYLLDRHESHFLNVVVHLFKVQWLLLNGDRVLSLENAFQLFLPFL